ncbi:hypothetical protein HOY80DRAFT_1076087 [Tuber brumale]|nr:hypothetical protein HOY80DRAFT_1076087 [Tuber brumale]
MSGSCQDAKIVLFHPAGGVGTWKTVSVSEASGSDKLTNSQSEGKYTYSAEARKGFYLWGAICGYETKNRDGSNATGAGNNWLPVSSITAFDAAAKVWKNDTIVAELKELREGALVYVAGVGDQGMLVRTGGCSPDFPSHSSRKLYLYDGSLGEGGVGFDTINLYDIAARVWYRQSTTSKTNIFPDNRRGGFCAGAVTAPDKASFTIYVYRGFKGCGRLEGTWALAMPYFQWFPMGSTGEPNRGRSSTSCQPIAGQLALARGRADQIDRGDPNGGSYFYDMTNLIGPLKYQPSEYRVPKAIYDVIGGNPSTSPNPVGGGGSSTGIPTDAIAGGVVGGIAGLAAIGASIWMLLRRHRKSAEMPKRSLAPGYEGSSPARYEINSVPVQQPVHELDNPGIQGGTHR